MPFTTPAYTARLPCEIPDSIPIHELLFGEGDKFGRYPLASSSSPFTCGISGKSHSAANVAERIENLAAALAADLEFEVNNGRDLDKVVALFSLNTVSPLIRETINGFANADRLIQ